ncbi:MAG: alpha-L-arabinofuranosidase C-terminal domain-containing protein, partial [Armatimonadota bacterium]|nr:alpha-L-arabinofuranosidase C-terminal domain-containing protein [Armatimonadota bacterium]
FINFDHKTWFPAPNYVVMKLWREHFAPYLIAIEGETKPLNTIATKSEDGKRVYFKVVNPTGQTVQVDLSVDGDVKSGSMQMLSSGDLKVRNTLDEPNRLRPEPAQVQVEDQTLKFTMPPYSVGVLTINLN